MNPTSLVRLVLALSLGALGCGSTVVSSDASADGSPPVDVPPDVPADVPPDVPSPPSACPSVEPTPGAPCARPSLACEYVPDPRRACRRVATCNGGAWRITGPETTGSEARPWCASPPPAAPCPATRETADGQSCDTVGAVCTFGGSLCACTPCVRFPIETCSRPPFWSCDAVPGGGCPVASPRFGEVCTQDGLSCEYGCNSPNGSVMCRDGVWQRGDFRDCPISTRRAKRDITYLSPAEVDALAAQIRATRLATYEYTLPAMAGRRRLGFILEDQPGSFAADPERSQVDLYGFASLLAATVQSQDRQLRDMRRRIETLERQLARRSR